MGLKRVEAICDKTSAVDICHVDKFAFVIHIQVQGGVLEDRFSPRRVLSIKCALEVNSLYPTNDIIAREQSVSRVATGSTGSV